MSIAAARWTLDHSACDFADKPVRCDRCHREYVCTPSSDYYCTPEGDHCCEPCLVGSTPSRVIDLTEGAVIDLEEKA